VPSSVELNANFTKNGPLYLAYNTDTLFVMGHVERAWNQIRAGMRKLYYSSNPRPSNASDIFIPDVGGAAGEIKLIVKPIIFHLPERANRQDANLFIVVSGRLSFDSANLRSLPLKTRRFETKVGYFRARGRSLEHVYGAHYDLDETQPGHPVFHSQMAPQHCFGTKIIDTYNLSGPPDDHVSAILRNVRIPTAQMDVFSVILQICADHLIHSGSSQDVKDAFNTLVAACSFFAGAGHRLEFLNREPAISCYRSTHWYHTPIQKNALLG
jgi:hypothetical protein